MSAQLLTNGVSTLRSPETQTAMSSLMTLPEMCEELGITEATAYYWRQIGKGPKGARLGKSLRYKRSEVEAWIDEQFARA